MPKGEMLSKDTSDIAKIPYKPKHTCKSRMLQAILDWKNLSCGCKDDYYNDIMSFERSFNGWDHDAILLTEWNWNRKKKDSYVFIEIKGIYTDISIVARALQYLLPSDEKISVDGHGDDLDFTIYHNDDYTSNTTYKLELMDLNQRKPLGYHDGWKFEIDNLKKE